MDQSTLDGLQPNIPEPTDTEVSEQIELAQKEYKVRLSGTEAVRYTKLKRELGWWLTLDSFITGSESIAAEKASAMQQFVRELTGESLSVGDARNQLEAVSAMTSKLEKDRIAAEIRDLVDSYSE